MESSLHRQLKQHYASGTGLVEAQLGQYRVDVLAGDHVIEIQQAGLGALRDKVRRLLKTHAVTVVKPIALVKQIVTCTSGGEVVRRRRSPKRGLPADLFDDLIHFVSVFPHPRLTLEVALVEIEEWRRPSRQRWSRRGYHVDDRKLVRVTSQLALHRPRDLLHLIPIRLPRRFDTANLADHLDIPRWKAQQIAYCLRRCGAAKTVGKKRNAWQYRVQQPPVPDLAALQVRRRSSQTHAS